MKIYFPPAKFIKLPHSFLELSRKFCGNFVWMKEMLCGKGGNTESFENVFFIFLCLQLKINDFYHET